MIHLFNVPFPKWNPCNPTDLATSPCISSLWNLIRAKTVYRCLDSDIYWKWPLVKVIANAWKGFEMRPWRFSIPHATKTEPGMLMGQCIKRETPSGRNFQTLARKANSENLGAPLKVWWHDTEAHRHQMLIEHEKKIHSSLWMCTKVEL